eukprot:CAMPEP_0179245680 /NCGR_PEP_ID=MMETSP0797-20121207/18700_1 /TAXON_ID=47934 /ORGANISM="Dinophysis acuminata, Strain DAEP01" /LENGTH=511 /DNA_ID=CAMNT_0020953239 /DNA_START=89 /DNA_END=1620 /DNA_ORIENTATION=+
MQRAGFRAPLRALGVRHAGSLGTFPGPKGPFETRLFINNEFVNAKQGKTFPTVNPATEEVITEVQRATSEDVDVAVAAAKAAFEEGSPWRESTGHDRRDALWKLATLIEENTEYLAAVESLDNGKPFKNAGYSAHTDLSLVVQCLKYHAGWAEKAGGRSVPLDNKMFGITRHEPVGVCGQIIPWNFPLNMLAWKLGPVLAAGCTTVVKTSEKTPLSALAVCKLIQESGVLPPGVVNMLSGYGPEAGTPLALHPDVDKIAFTGSSAVGHKIVEYSAQSNLKKVTLELGGKSPLIVLPDADLDQAAMAAHIGLFLNHGQCCCAGSRTFVHEDIYDAFVAKVVELARNWKTGDPTQFDTMQGPVVDKIQFDKIMGYIEKGKAEGAKLETGGDRAFDSGYYIQPTVFTGVEDGMTIAQEEIFGPVMSVLKFRDFDEALKRANATKYGLGAAIASRDIGKALKGAYSLRAGTVWINCFNHFDAACPFGGFKESGWGRELGAYGISAYQEVKTIYCP